MLLIADSGATNKTGGFFTADRIQGGFRPAGANPFFVDTLHIKNEVEKELVPFIDSKGVTEVYFYGAGCSSTEKSIIVEDGLKPLFPSARVKVCDDLLGAARALCGRSEGIACILGTGTNSCLLDGKNLQKTFHHLAICWR